MGQVFTFCAVYFSTVPRASGPVFMFCALGLVFDGIEGIGSHFHVLLSCTHFRRYRGRRVTIPCFALLYSFSTVPRVSCHVFIFFAPGLIFGGTGASGHISKFCAFVLVFDGTEGVRSLFPVLCSGTHFGRNRGRRVPFTCVFPDSFSVVPRASGPIYMFCAT
jgi:hypothetical protein